MTVDYVEAYVMMTLTPLSLMTGLWSALSRKVYKDDLFVYFNKKYIYNFNHFHYFFPAKQQKMTEDK